MNQGRWREQGGQPPRQVAGATLGCPTPPVVQSSQPEQSAAVPVTGPSLVEQLLAGIHGLVGNVIDALTAGAHQGYMPANVMLVDTSQPVFEMPFSPAVFEAHIQNDGPNTVQYRIPNVGNPGWAILNPTEDVWIKFNRPVIGAVGLTMPAPAGSASVRLVGVR